MKILQLHKNLSATEKRRIKEALGSPFFNKNGKLLQVWEVLDKHPDLAPDEVKAIIHKRLFAKAEYDDLVIRHLVSKLHKLVEEIIGIVKMQAQQQPIKLAYAEWLNEHGLASHHEQQMEEYAASPPQSLNDYYWQYQWLQERERFANRHQVRHDNPILQQVSDAFDQYFIAHKLKMACAAYSLQTMYKQQFNIGLVDAIVANYELEEPTEPMPKLYYYSLQTLRSIEPETFFHKLKEELLALALSIDPAEQMDLFILAQNFCIRKVNAGHEAYFQELFDLYQATLSKNLIQHDAVQFPPAFKNIISVALRLKAFDWVEKFIKTHTDYLEPEYRNDYLHYNLARVHFEQNDFEAAQDHLLKVLYKDFFIGLNARMLLLKTYYELDLYDLAHSQADSFKQYLNRKGIMAYHKQNYQNNVKYVKRLMNLNIYDKARKKLLNEQISGEQVLTEKRWLVEKLELLSSK